MANYSSNILNTASGALSANQALIGVLSNNIANVNTPGYVRRSIVLQARPDSGRGNGSFGGGVEVGPLQRSVNSYLDKLVREAGSDKASFGVQEELLNRIDKIFDLTSSGETIGKAFTNFFSAINDLKVQPSSIELRSAVLNQAQTLVSLISDTFSTIAEVQDEADGRLDGEVAQVNGMLDEIAKLNGVIVSKESASGIAADDRDKREELIRQLTEKIGVSSIEQTDGTALITLPGGFPLVVSTTARHLSVTDSPSFAAAAGVPPLLSGRLSRYIVFDYAPGSATSREIDLTSAVRSAGGSLGGLVAIRGINSNSSTSPFTGDGPLVALASRVESIARALLTQFNETYRGPDNDATTPTILDASAVNLDNGVPGVFGFFTAQLTETTTLTDSDADGRPTYTDLAASGAQTFADKLRLAISSPREIAAAIDADPASGAPVLAPGNGENLEALSALRTATFSLGTLVMSAVPVTGSQSLTLEDGYQEMLTYFGGVMSSAQLGAKNAESRYIVAKQQRDQEAGVNLDEEFTQLVKFQRAFEASSRLVKAASDILDTVIGLI